MEVRVLGPVELCGEGDSVAVTGAKPRALLTFLSLHVGEIVPLSTLIELLWGDDAPRTAERSLQTHVSTVRRAIGADGVVRHGDGWQLAVASVDVVDFTAAVRHGREAKRAGQHLEACEHYQEALALWRGSPVLPTTPRGIAELTHWDEVHDDLVEERGEVLLASGEAASLVADLEAAVAEAPLRERRWALLMIALYRSGRQAEALRAFQRLREVLADELGLEPSAELKRLERRIVLHDEALATPTATGGPAPDASVPPDSSGGDDGDRFSRRERTEARPRRDRESVRRVAASGTEPFAILAAGGGAAVGIAVGSPVVAIVLAGMGWLAVAVPSARRSRPSATGGPGSTTDLREPWRQFVMQAQDAQARIRTTVDTVASGPLSDRLRQIGEQVDRGVEEARRVARRGQELDDVRRQIDTFRIERELDELDDTTAASSPTNRARMFDALRSQLASADRLDQILTDAHDRLRLLVAGLGEAVARTFELSARSTASSDLGDVDMTLEDVVEEMEALRLGLDDAGGRAAGAAD
jgi:DNA-binding SARP family transcriptional activator